MKLELGGLKTITDLEVNLNVRDSHSLIGILENWNARSQDQASLAVSKITQLLTTYDASLNTLSKAYFGVTQEVNTAELVVSYHNVTSVFNVTQSVGITLQSLG